MGSRRVDEEACELNERELNKLYMRGEGGREVERRKFDFSE